MYTEYMSMLGLPNEKMIKQEYLRFPIVDNCPNLVCNTLASYGIRLPEGIVSPHLSKVTTASFFTNEIYIKYYSDTLTMLKYHLIDLLLYPDATVNNSQLLLSFRYDFPEEFDRVSDIIVELFDYLKDKIRVYYGDVLKLTSFINSDRLDTPLRVIADAIDTCVPLKRGTSYYKVAVEDYPSYIEKNKLLLRYRTKLIDIRTSDSVYRSIGYSPVVFPLVGMFGISGIRYINKGDTITAPSSTRPETPPLKWIPELMDYLKNESIDSTQNVLDRINLKLTKSKANSKIKKLAQAILISEYVCKAVEENNVYSSNELYKYLVV